MLFYDFNELDNFIKNNLINNLSEEKENIERIAKLYENKKDMLSDIITNILEKRNLTFIEENKEDVLFNAVSLIRTSLEQITYIEDLIEKLNVDINSTISLYDRGIQNNDNEIKANLVEYNKKRDELFNKILEFENSYTSTINATIELFSKKPQKGAKEEKNDFLEQDHKLEVNIDLEPNNNDTLIISEKEQKAYLPFFYEDIKNIYQKENKKYNTMQDVVKDLYIVPLNQFKSSSISRFRESFNLIRNKEKGSITKALDLGLELMFKYELNPIIIAACRNLNELDIYLDCLEENELYDFKCFKIKFEVMPKIVKNSKKDTFN